MRSAHHAKVALVGDQYNHDEPAHPRIEALLPELGFYYEWVPTREITDDTDLSGWDAIWVVPGAPYHAQQGVHRAIRFARENGVPFLGTCGGFYSAVLEYAQNVLHMEETAELGDELGPIEQLILPPTCVQSEDHKVGLSVREGSNLSAIYQGATRVQEILQCNYGMVQEFLDKATQGDVRFSAWDDAAAPRALEIAGHPFFTACLYQPELSSTPDSVHPIVQGFLDAAVANAGRKTAVSA